MSLLTTVDHLHRFVVVRATGEISTSEVLAHLDAERAESGLAYRELIDGRGARLHWSSADARKIVEAIRHRSRSTRFGPTAIVVDSDLGYGMLRMIEILLEDVAAVRPFRHLEEAERWLRDPVFD